MQKYNILPAVFVFLRAVAEIIFRKHIGMKELEQLQVLSYTSLLGFIAAIRLSSWWMRPYQDSSQCSNHSRQGCLGVKRRILVETSPLISFLKLDRFGLLEVLGKPLACTDFVRAEIKHPMMDSLLNGEHLGSSLWNVSLSVIFCREDWQAHLAASLFLSCISCYCRTAGSFSTSNISPSLGGG